MIDVISTTELRGSLDGYLKQVRAGQRFIIRHYKLQIGTLARPKDMPSEFRADVLRAGFTEVRDDVSLIRKTLARGRGLLVTKRKSGTRDRTDKAAIWPVPAAQVELKLQRIEELNALIANLEATALRLQGQIRGSAR